MTVYLDSERPISKSAQSKVFSVLCFMIEFDSLTVLCLTCCWWLQRLAQLPPVEWDTCGACWIVTYVREHIACADSSLLLYHSSKANQQTTPSRCLWDAIIQTDSLTAKLKAGLIEAPKIKFFGDWWPHYLHYLDVAIQHISTPK